MLPKNKAKDRLSDLKPFTHSYKLKCDYCNKWKDECTVTIECLTPFQTNWLCEDCGDKRKNENKYKTGDNNEQVISEQRMVTSKVLRK